MKRGRKRNGLRFIKTFLFQSGGGAGGGAGAGGGGGSEVTPGHVKLVKRGNKMEVLL